MNTLPKRGPKNCQPRNGGQLFTKHADHCLKKRCDGMCAGSNFRLIVPRAEAYGERGLPLWVPPCATLDIEFMLLQVKREFPSVYAGQGPGPIAACLAVDRNVLAVTFDDEVPHDRQPFDLTIAPSSDRLRS